MRSVGSSRRANATGSFCRRLAHGADCLILDERFAALDPETLHQALPCVLERAPTLLGSAHP